MSDNFVALETPRSKVELVGAALDQTFGRSSTTGSHREAVRGSLFGENKVKLVYDIRQNFPLNYNLHDIKANLEAAGRKAFNVELARIKKRLKDDFSESVSFKELSCTNDLQIFSFTNVNRQGRFVMECILEF